MLQLFIFFILSTTIQSNPKTFFDPFRKLIVKKEKTERKAIVRASFVKKTEQVIPPLMVEVVGMSRSHESTQLILRYKGKMYLVTEGDSVEQDFTIKGINENIVSLFHKKAKRNEFVSL